LVFSTKYPGTTQRALVNIILALIIPHPMELLLPKYFISMANLGATLVRDILEADDNVIAVFNGHHHPGAKSWWEDTHDDPDSNVYHTATGVFGEEHNGIRYYNLRGSIIGWGSDSSGPIEEPSNVYYVLTVKKGQSISIEVESFRTN
jgi:hypothetical protein